MLVSLVARSSGRRSRAGDRPLPQTRWLGMHATRITPPPRQSLGGHIELESTPGQGSDLRLILPQPTSSRHHVI